AARTGATGTAIGRSAPRPAPGEVVRHRTTAYAERAGIAINAAAKDAPAGEKEERSVRKHEEPAARAADPLIATHSAGRYLGVHEQGVHASPEREGIRAIAQGYVAAECAVADAQSRESGWESEAEIELVIDASAKGIGRR